MGEIRIKNIWIQRNKSMLTFIKSNLFTGFIVLLPILVFLIIIVFLFQQINAILNIIASFSPVVAKLTENPTTSLLLWAGILLALILLITLVGFVVSLTIGRRVKKFRVAKIDWPRKDLEAIVFVTGEKYEDGKKKYSIFVPTTPNPTSGFLNFASEEEVKFLPHNIFEASRTVISGGALKLKKKKEVK